MNKHIKFISALLLMLTISLSSFSREDGKHAGKHHPKHFKKAHHKHKHHKMKHK
ncbi:hypothetical protein [Parasediminibacterium sp. JCM 36343]|uniref:hypothetical protein n=1 Tax=Parasediminibacterium sp. JCM 36343 TaxID=3374279 RepID=UPI00397AABED